MTAKQLTRLRPVWLWLWLWLQEADAAEQEKLNKIIDDKVQARLKKDPASTTTTNHTHSSCMSH